MSEICITFSSGKEFRQEDVTKVSYLDESENEVIVSGEGLYSHKFPIKGQEGVLMVYTETSSSTVRWKDIRSITFEQDIDL